MMSFIAEGGIFMILIILMGLAILAIAGERFLTLFLRKEGASATRGLRALRNLGVGSALLGVLGTMMGVYQAFSSARLIESGMPIYDVVRIALSTSIVGIALALAALVFHGLFEARAAKLASSNAS